VNVFAIAAARDEGAVETVDDLMCDLIGLVLQPLDRFDVWGAAVGAAWNNCRKCSTASLLRLATSVNNTKNSFFARQETHGISGGVVDRKG